MIPGNWLRDNEFMAPISRVEMIWNEAQMFNRDIISSAWLDINWKDLPDEIQDQFASLVLIKDDNK